MPSNLRVRIIAGAIACTCAAPAAAAAQDPPSFAQLAGAQGCLVGELAVQDQSSEIAAQGCTPVRALGSAAGIALSPDERHVYVTSAGSVVTLARAPDTGALSFVGCVTESGDDGRPGTEGLCTDGDALGAAWDVEVSPDGRFVYVTSSFSDGIAWFTRDSATGALTPSGCLKESPRADRCGTAFGLDEVRGVAIAPDGRHLYVASQLDSAVVGFLRDPASGALSPVGCVSDGGSDGRCVNGTGLVRVHDVIVAPDGQSAYAVTRTGAVTGFGRDPASGVLTQRACLLSAPPAGSTCLGGPALAGPTAIALSPDGRDLLVAANGDSALSVFGRDSLAPVACYRHAAPEGDDREVIPEDEDDDDDARTSQTTSCHPAKALAGIAGLAVSNDGRAVFTTGGNGYFAAFRRDPATGSLEQFGCLENEPGYRSCLDARAGWGGDEIVTTADGRNVYVTSQFGVTVLGASAAVVSRTARASSSGSVGVRLACPRARAAGCRGRLTVASRAARRYRLAPGKTAQMRVRLPAPTRRTLRARGRATIAVTARDADRRTGSAARRVLVTRR